MITLHFVVVVVVVVVVFFYCCCRCCYRPVERDPQDDPGTRLLPVERRSLRSDAAVRISFRVVRTTAVKLRTAAQHIQAATSACNTPVLLH